MDQKPVYVKLGKEGSSFYDFHAQFSIHSDQVKPLPAEQTTLMKSWIREGGLVVVTDEALISGAVGKITPEPAAPKETAKQRAAREKKEAADAELEHAKQAELDAQKAAEEADKGDEGDGEEQGGEKTLEQLLAEGK